ncbi:O-methyltransferase-domain-containing protein [Delphinella strobiligena]|nr:O-methyltransferase-domain-containing protein [Delphinella strobiligena]
MPSSPSVSRLVRLSEIIARNSKLLNSHLIEKKLPQPSFSADAPPDGIYIGKNEPRRKELERAKRELVSATNELYDLSVGPRESVRNLAWDFNRQLSLHFIQHFKIAQAFAPSETITFTELSVRTKTPLHELKRLVRHAISANRIFTEPVKNTIAHTAASRVLAEDKTADAWAGMCLEEFWPGAVGAVEALERWPGSQEPVHTGLSVSLGKEKHLWEVVTSAPERMHRFGLGMKSHSEAEGFEVDHLVENYDWGRLAGADGAPGVVVDVGGSLGYTCVAIRRAHPSLKFIVQDLGKVHAKTNAAEQLPEEMKNRIEFMTHDFFEPQPVKGADVYLIRWCLHNWSDKYSIKILRALVPGLKKGARVVINDGAAEEVDADIAEHRAMRNLDLIMLEGLNARERDLGEWEDLFAEADERFVFMGARPSGRMWIIEAEWNGEDMF